MTRTRLTITQPFLRTVHRQLRDSPEGRELQAGLAVGPDGREILLPAAPDAPGPRARVRIFRLTPGLEGITHRYWHAFPRTREPGIVVELGLLGERGGSAAVLVDGEIQALDEVFCTGAGMDRWVPAMPPPDLLGRVPADGPFSRYIGALGGDAVHERLRRAWATIFGAARLGSAAATALARAGCQKVFLVDPDVLEPHSEDAVECFPGRGSRAKVAALQDSLALAAPWTEVVALPVLANAPAALAAVRQSALIVSAPDRDDARFCASLLATAYHRLHIDLGTGVFDVGGRWRAGADVRVIMPGQGCLQCVGGLDLRTEAPVDWRRQRAGSLRSLNHLAVSTAMLQYERGIVGSLSETRWTRIEVGEDGGHTTRRMPVVWDPACPLCSRWSGAGDAVFTADGGE